MCSIREMIQRLDYVQNNLINMTGEVISRSDVEYDIISLNKSQLYDEGIGSDGLQLMSYKSVLYAEMKFLMRGRELTDLYLDGGFQRNFYLVIDGDVYFITSSDWKTEKLVQKYGERIFGLTEENKVKAHLIFRPYLLESVNDVMQCQIGS